MLEYSLAILTTNLRFAVIMVSRALSSPFLIRSASSISSFTVMSGIVEICAGICLGTLARRFASMVYPFSEMDLKNLFTGDICI